MKNFRGPQNLSNWRRSMESKTWSASNAALCIGFSAGAQSRIRTDRPLMEQIIAAREPFEREWGAGIHVWPIRSPRFRKLPDFALKAARALLPKQVMAIVAVFDRDEVWTSLIVELTNAEVTLITTTDTLQPLKLEGLDSSREGEPAAGCAHAYTRPSDRRRLHGPREFSNISRRTRSRSARSQDSFA